MLAGRVVDELGEAVAEAEVTAMRMQFTNGKRRLVPSGRNGTTNDLGQFRIYGLPPGEYYVSATLRNMTTMMIDMIGGGVGRPDRLQPEHRLRVDLLSGHADSRRGAARRARGRPGAAPASTSSCSP